MVKSLNGMVKALLPLMALAWATGCATRPEMAPRDIRVTVDDSLRSPDGRLASVQVDLIAVNPTEYPRWTSVDVDEYWGPPAHQLQSAQDRYVMTFDYQENVATKVMRKTDPLWTQWKNKGAMDLVAIARIPGVARTGGVGQQDTRRLILPLDKRRWADLGELRIQVSRSGITSLSQPGPEPKR